MDISERLLTVWDKSNDEDDRKILEDVYEELERLRDLVGIIRSKHGWNRPISGLVKFSNAQHDLIAELRPALRTLVRRPSAPRSIGRAKRLLRRKLP